VACIHAKEPYFSTSKKPTSLKNYELSADEIGFEYVSIYYCVMKQVERLMDKE